MAAYTGVLNNDASDLSPFVDDNRSIKQATSAGTIDVNLAGSETQKWGFITESGIPNSNVWEQGGTWTVEYSSNAGNHAVKGACRCVRVNNDGVILQSGSLTATQILNADRTFTPTNPNWNTIDENLDNRLAIEFEFINTTSMAQSVTFNVNTSAAQVTTNISTDFGFGTPSGTTALFISGPKQINSLKEINFRVVLGAEDEFHSAGGPGPSEMDGVAIGSSAFVVVYKDGSDGNHGTANVGTVSGTTIAFGAEEEYAPSSFALNSKVEFLEDDKLIFTWSGASDHSKAMVGIVSGTTITFGAEVDFHTTGSGSLDNGLAVLNGSGFVVSYQDSDAGFARIGVVDGTDITFGEETQYAADPTFTTLSRLHSSGFIVEYTDDDDLDKGKAKVGIFNGTNISFGSESIYSETTVGFEHTLLNVDADKFVVVYEDDASSDEGICRVGTVDGTDITFGPKAVFLSSGNIGSFGITNFDASKFIVAFKDFDDGDVGQIIVGEIDGTNIIFSETTRLPDTIVNNIVVNSLDDIRFVIAYTDSGDSGHGTAKIGTLTFDLEGALLFIEGIGFASTSGDLFISGEDGINSINSSINLFINGPDTIALSGDLFIEGHKFFQSSGDLYIQGHNTLQASGDLFIRGPDTIAISGDLFIVGHETVQISGDIFMSAKELITASGDLFISGVADVNSINSSINLFINGHNIVNASGDLFLRGHIVISTSGDLFVRGFDQITSSGDLYIQGHEDITASGDLFIQGNESVTTSSDLFIEGHEQINNFLEISPSVLFGIEAEFLSADGAQFISVSSFDSSKFVVIYQDSSDGSTGKARIGTVSGTSIIFGAVAEFSSAVISNNNVAVLEDDKFVTAWFDVGTLFGKSIIGTVSGTTITFGTEVEYLSTAGSNWVGLTDLNASGFVVAYENSDVSDHGFTKIGTVNGTDITFGNGDEFLGGLGAGFPTLSRLHSSGYIVSYQDKNDSDKGKAKIGIYTGTNTSFGSGSQFVTNIPADSHLFTIDENKFVVSYRDLDDSNHGKSNVGTVSGTTITFGPEAIFLDDGTALSISAINFNTSKFFVTYGSGLLGQAKIGSIDGLNITFGDNIEPSFFGFTSFNEVAILDDTRLVIVYRDHDDSNHGTAKIGTLIDGFEVTTLFIEGHENVATSGDLFISGAVGVNSINSSINLFIDGHNIVNTSGDLFLRGHIVISTSGDLFVLGFDQITSSGDLYIQGHEDVTTLGDLFINGHILGTISGDLFIHGLDNIALSGDLFIEGHQNNASSGDLFAQGQDNVNTSANLFINGLIEESGVQTPSLFIDGHESISISGDLFINGHESNAVSGDLYIRGLAISTISGDLFIDGQDNASSSGDLFIEGHESNATSGDLYIRGLAISSTSGDLFVKGHDTNNDSITLFMHGLDNIASSGDLFVQGSNIIDISGDLFISGSIPVASLNVSVDLFINGFSFESGQLNLFIRGIAVAQRPVASINLFINGFEPKPALVCPILDPTASIQIKDSLIKIYQSRIDALVNQLGKNVLLEFDPIRTPCPNCTFDRLRNRSTGIHIPGGPRPFTRGRRCPYCKGRGLLETAVTKCIKCLIKWNPEDDENFDIGVTEETDIVRLKTFLTEIDDLIRARTVIVNHDIKNQMTLRARLVQGPIPVGLREDRYCISFWELI